MKKIAIVYYSRTGNTEAMARFIEEGLKMESDIQVDTERVENFPASKALEYNALIIGSPTYYGSMSWEIKKFLDETVDFHGKLSVFCSAKRKIYEGHFICLA